MLRLVESSPVPSSLLTNAREGARQVAHHHALSDETPLERLCRCGSSSLSDSELLSLFLRSGCSQDRALGMAQEVLADSGLVGLLDWKPATLLRLKGFGVAKVGTVLALAELVQRMTRPRPQRPLMEQRDRVAAYLYPRYDQKVTGALYVDVRSRLIKDCEIYRGTSYCTAVEPRALLEPALLCNAAGMILFHVLPSGVTPTASADDLDFTHRLKPAAEICGVVLRDHLFLGSGGRFVSVESPPRKKRRILLDYHTPGKSAGTKEPPQC